MKIREVTCDLCDESGKLVRLEHDASRDRRRKSRYRYEAVDVCPACLEKMRREMLTNVEDGV